MLLTLLILKDAGINSKEELCTLILDRNVLSGRSVDRHQLRIRSDTGSLTVALAVAAELQQHEHTLYLQTVLRNLTILPFP